jgi:thioredoxin 1
MNQIRSILAFFSILLVACSNLQSQNSKFNLTPTEFNEKMSSTSEALLLDVRTPEEYEKGHLNSSKNIDWNASNFDSQIALLDKSQPVFVYCLSGGRSSSAANKMRQEGFKEVYELKGGIMKWRAENLPETTKIKSSGMTKEQFDALLVSDKLVLIDFYADWCAPCKKMKPFLEEISKEMESSVTVIRINADENPELCKQYGVDALPVLNAYKGKNMVWKNEGFIDKKNLVEKLNSLK